MVGKVFAGIIEVIVGRVMMFKWGNYNFPFFSLNETIVGNMGTFRKREYPKVFVNQQTDVR